MWSTKEVTSPTLASKRGSWSGCLHIQDIIFIWRRWASRTGCVKKLKSDSDRRIITYGQKARSAHRSQQQCWSFSTAAPRKQSPQEARQRRRDGCRSSFKTPSNGQFILLLSSSSFGKKKNREIFCDCQSVFAVATCLLDKFTSGLGYLLPQDKRAVCYSRMCQTVTR